MRHLDVIVEFTQPRPRDCHGLSTALGRGHAEADADLNRLTAAVLAQEKGRAIACPDIAGALRIEYRKLGWTVPAELMHSVAGAIR